VGVQDEGIKGTWIAKAWGMQRQVRHKGDLIHPALVATGPGLLAAGTALDVLAAGRADVLAWLAFWTIATGVALGTWCATWALLDWVFFARRGNAGLDGFATATVVGLYGLAAFIRLDSPAHSAQAPALALEVGAAALLGMKGWIGSELARG
jgi:hypothetical protein